MNWLGIISVPAAILAFFASRRSLFLRPVRTRLVFCLLLAVLAVPGLWFSVYYLHLLPDMAVFYTLRSWTGTEFLVVFAAAAGGALTTLLPRRWLWAPLLFTILAAIIPYLKMAVNPLDARELHEEWVDGACLQSCGSTCGPASAASIVRFLGGTASEREIAEGSFSTKRGTEAWYLARYLRSRGLHTRFVFSPGFNPEAGLPAVVGVGVAGYGHFIAVLKIDGDRVIFADPLVGRREMTLADFRKSYLFSGFRMEVTRGGGN